MWLSKFCQGKYQLQAFNSTIKEEASFEIYDTQRINLLSLELYYKECICQ